VATRYDEDWDDLADGAPWPARTFSFTGATTGGTVDVQGKRGRTALPATVGAFAIGTVVDGPWADLDAYVDVAIPTAAGAAAAMVETRFDGGTTSGYRAGLRPGSDVMELRRVDSGAVTVLDSAPFTFAATDDRVRLRVQTLGTRLRAKVWRSGTEEPAEWMVEAIDSTYATGSLQIGASDWDSTGTARELFWDNLTVSRLTLGAVNPVVVYPSHDPVFAFRADLLWEREVIQSDLPVLGFRINVDGSADIRRAMSAELQADPDLIPQNSGSALAPYGAEIQLRGGWWWDTNKGWQRTLHSGGIFRIDVATIRRTAEQRGIALEGQDRAASVDAGGFWATTTVQPGDDIIERITTMLDRALPGVETNFASASYAAPRLLVWEEGDSPWKACRELAASIGMELFFDANGVCVLRRISSIVHTVPAVDYVVGTSDITSIERTFDARSGYNRYVVIGQDTALKPVRGVAKDDDPNSPTYYGGRFGKRTAPIIRDPAVGTTAQAVEAARGWLNRDRGGTEDIELVTLPDWRREAGDVARIVDREMGISESAVVENFVLTPDSMTVTTAAKRTVPEEAQSA
jgi:hypothetical protein